MKCPYCGHPESKVTDSRTVDDGIRRRRACLACGARFTTYERVQPVELYVIKRDGRREPFNREKLLSGVRKACEKRPLPAGALEALVSDVETVVSTLGKPEVPSSVIGDLVMERLRDLDKIAYIRFASVYRSFADVEDLRQELENLVRPQGPRRLPNQLALLPEEGLEQLSAGSRLLPLSGEQGVTVPLPHRGGQQRGRRSVRNQ